MNLTDALSQVQSHVSNDPITTLVSLAFTAIVGLSSWIALRISWWMTKATGRGLCASWRGLTSWMRHEPSDLYVAILECLASEDAVADDHTMLAGGLEFIHPRGTDVKILHGKEDLLKQVPSERECSWIRSAVYARYLEVTAQQREKTQASLAEDVRKKRAGQQSSVMPAHNCRGGVRIS